MEFINSQKYWNLSSTLMISLFVFLFFSLIQTLILLLYTSTSQETLNYENIAYANLGVISLGSSLIGILFLVFFIKIKNHNLKQYLNLHLPNFNISVIFFLLAIFMMFGMEYVSNLYPDIFETDFVIESYKQAKSLPILYCGVVLFGPVFEECLFRGFLFKGLEKSFLGGNGAVFVSAILFSCVHVQYGLYILLFMIFPMAILLGYARLKSGSLLLPILIHVINNLATCLLMHFEVY